MKTDGAKSRGFVAIRIEDPKLIEDLEQHGVKYRGEVANPFVGELLRWGSSSSSWSRSGASSSAGWVAPKAA